MTTSAQQPADVVIDPGDADTMARGLTRRFVERYDRPPDGVFAAPGRVNLIGEHTDYNQGLCLPIAIPHATYAAIAARNDDIVTIVSVQQHQQFEARLDSLGPDQVSGWAAYAAGVVWAARQAGIEVPGVDVVVDSTVPIGAGLSSSAALECAVGLAIAAAAGLDLDEPTRRRLIEICGRAEREVARAPTGGMDQTVSLLARQSHALLLDCRTGSVEHVPWDPAAHGVELLVVDTRAAHALTDGDYGSRRDECERAAHALGVDALRAIADEPAALDALTDPVLHRRARHVASEIGRVDEAIAALAAADLSELGRVFNASHASLRDDFEVSCAELDAVCDAALRAGALGARMTGGGFGGSAIALVPVDRVERARAIIADEFRRRGWNQPRFLSAPASAGARRI